MKLTTEAFDTHLLWTHSSNNFHVSDILLGRPIEAE